LRRGLALDSHRNGTIQAGPLLEVKIKAGNRVLPAAAFLRNGKKLPDSCTFAQNKTGRIQVNAAFPEAGEYALRVFARNKRAAGSFEQVLEYRVQASSGKPERHGFPTAYADFVERGGCLYSPMERYLESGKGYEFKIKAPEATKVGVLQKGKWHSLRRGGTFQKTVRAAKGKIMVCAKYPGKKEYSVLLEYVGY